jgi:hypothetical protein
MQNIGNLPITTPSAEKSGNFDTPGDLMGNGLPDR